MEMEPLNFTVHTSLHFICWVEVEGLHAITIVRDELVLSTEYIQREREERARTASRLSNNSIPGLEIIPPCSALLFLMQLRGDILISREITIVRAENLHKCTLHSSPLIGGGQ